MQGVLFDVGYTLMDESRRLAAALEWLADRLGKTAAELRDRYVAACATPSGEHPSLVVQVLADLGVGRDAAEGLRSELPWDTEPLDPYPDAAACVCRVREAGFKTGVLANQPASAREDLDRCFPDAFDDIWLSDPVGLAKPDPAFFRLALDRWGLEAGDVAYVGDRPDNDTKPARALGLYTVRVRLGPHARQAPRNETERADADVETLADAAEHLLGRS